jgi:hypothetical protein
MPKSRKRTARQKQSRTKPGPVVAAQNPVSRRTWMLRLSVAVVFPLLFFLLLEGILRLTGFGYATSFFLSKQIKGREVVVQNDRFGWRFFGPEMAREPWPLLIPSLKPADTIRIFVLGESAAYGDPQPEFGLPRMLKAMLDLRYP